MATKRRFRTTLAANESNPDITPGDMRIAPNDGFIQMANVSDTANAIEVGMAIASINVLIDALVSIEVAAGRGIVLPDNVIITEEILDGQALNINARNLTAGVVVLTTDLEYLRAA